ncbi:MAG: CRISPR system precrRNA processing endoribonuclease RAMP protein Cas6 [Minicystis sp.]
MIASSTHAPAPQRQPPKPLSASASAPKPRSGSSSAAPSSPRTTSTYPPSSVTPIAASPPSPRSTARPTPTTTASSPSSNAIAAQARTVERHIRPLRWERWSIEKDVRHPMRGLAGSILVEGPIGPLIPVLRAAEIVHVGKATSHGLGRLAIDVIVGAS